MVHKGQKVKIWK